MPADLPSRGPLATRPASAGHRRFLRRLRSDPLVVTGGIVVAVFAVAALAAPLLAPYDPIAVDPASRLTGPSREHVLGTDALGRDLLSRLLYGSRWSLGVATLATVLVMSLGIAVGTVSGYVGGRTDQFLMRLVDVVLAFPGLIAALAIAGALGPGIHNVVLGLVTVWWADYARIVRGIVLGVRELHFVEAARALGATDRRVMLRHLLPQVLPPVSVLATLEIGSLILALAGLNFLGLGVQPPTPEWGAMINQGRAYLTTAPHLMLYPGLAISVVVLGFNFLGDGLRDVLDPHLIRR